MSFQPASGQESLNIVDYSFDPGTWTAKIYGGSRADQTNIALTKISSGARAGLRGNAQQSNVRAPGGFSFDAAQIKLDASWNPKTNGRIDEITYLADYNIATPGIRFSALAVSRRFDLRTV